MDPSEKTPPLLPDLHKAHPDHPSNTDGRGLPHPVGPTPTVLWRATDKGWFRTDTNCISRLLTAGCSSPSSQRPPPDSTAPQRALVVFCRLPMPPALKGIGRGGCGSFGDKSALYFNGRISRESTSSGS